MENSDSIPQIQIQDSTLAFPSIFGGSFIESTIVKRENRTIRFDVENNGFLKVPSGKIIASDPIVLHDSNPFAHQFPTGEFPDELSIL